MNEAQVAEAMDENLNPLGLNLGADLQHFDRLELNSIAGHENSQMQSSSDKISALQRSKSKRIAKTKSRLPVPSKKLDYEDK